MTIKMSLIDFLTAVYLTSLVVNIVVTNVKPLYVNYWAEEIVNISKSSKIENELLTYGVVTNLVIVMLFGKSSGLSVLSALIFGSIKQIKVNPECSKLCFDFSVLPFFVFQ